ncbi:hypothetical protein QBC47DRAFT_295524 [Echria macrotheca]|uniref:F-box domain-containing protein n=1 Tax=Echria macrotheca TaxID=438768 RepID=A0AAJ0FEH2_9PEZI|nr:hypothetical protein QBC47DRAFT_295524 [Echria macrotheca]
MATFLAWIKTVCPCGRREVETENEADIDDGINKVDAADVEDITEQVDEADVANEVAEEVADEVAGRGQLPPQLSISAGGQVNTRQQVEKKHEHHHHYPWRVPLSLRAPESAGIDPLVAAHVHNANHSPIYRLPDELVLQVLRYLGDDLLTMLCLRRVATRFRRIIDDRKIWKVLCINRCLERRSHRIFEREYLFPKDLRQELWHRIQRDGACDQCRMLRAGYPDNSDSGWPHRECPVVSRSPLGLHCHGCSSGGHDVHPCLACHGAVRLCEHVNISWADMQPYLSEWQQQPDDLDGQACLDGFSVECRHLSHDTRCRAEDAPTWPRASLKSERHWRSRWVVFLALEWKPHSGPDVFSLTSEMRAPASEMRTLFQRHRQGAAEILMPSSPQAPFPEMAGFEDPECRCLYYETGSDQRSSSASASKPTQRTLFWPCTWSHGHIYVRHHGRERTCELVSIRAHSAHRTTNSYCLVTEYCRNITVCWMVKRGGVGVVIPAYDWYHAVDPDLSPSPRSAKTPCRDKSCINYYRSPASFACRDYQLLKI